VLEAVGDRPRALEAARTAEAGFRTGKLPAAKASADEAAALVAALASADDG
jgi:hypothetical protein